MKADKTVKKETGILLAGTLILSAVMTLIFVLVGKFNYTVVTGALLGGLASVLNFFLMGIVIQNVVHDDPETAKKKIILHRKIMIKKKKKKNLIKLKFQVHISCFTQKIFQFGLI